MTSLPLCYWLFLTALSLGAVLGIAALLDGFGSDLDLDAEADGPPAAASVDGDAEHGGAELGTTLWTALGVGRIPFGALAAVDLLLFGGLGIVFAEASGSVLPASVASWIAFPPAAVLAVLLGGRLAGVLARRLPAVESHGAVCSDLIGRLGHAELDIDGRFGRARVRDAGGALHQVRCVAEGEPISRGTMLIVTDFDPARCVFSVERADLWLDGVVGRNEGPVTDSSTHPSGNEREKAS